MKGRAFSRFAALMSAVFSAAGTAVPAVRAAEIDRLGGYHSRGHGRGFSYSNTDGSARVKRAARKRRNVLRNRHR